MRFYIPNTSLCDSFQRLVKKYTPVREPVRLVPTFTVAYLHGAIALYDGDDLKICGDVYDDRTGTRVNGFFEGLDHAGFQYVRDHIYVTFDLMDEVPCALDELKEGYKWEEA